MLFNHSHVLKTCYWTNSYDSSDDLMNMLSVHFVHIITNTALLNYLNCNTLPTPTNSPSTKHTCPQPTGCMQRRWMHLTCSFIPLPDHDVHAPPAQPADASTRPPTTLHFTYICTCVCHYRNCSSSASAPKNVPLQKCLTRSPTTAAWPRSPTFSRHGSRCISWGCPWEARAGSVGRRSHHRSRHGRPLGSVSGGVAGCPAWSVLGHALVQRSWRWGVATHVGRRRRNGLGVHMRAHDRTEHQHCRHRRYQLLELLGHFGGGSTISRPPLDSHSRGLAIGDGLHVLAARSDSLERSTSTRILAPGICTRKNLQSQTSSQCPKCCTDPLFADVLYLAMKWIVKGRGQRLGFVGAAALWWTRTRLAVVRLRRPRAWWRCGLAIVNGRGETGTSAL